MSSEHSPGQLPGARRSPGYRLSDAERDTAITALGDAYAEGRLDVDEFQSRMAAASRAKFAADLDELFVDLPRNAAPTSAARPSRDGGRGRRVGAPPRRGTPWIFASVLLILLLAVTTHFWILLPILFILTRRAHHRAARLQWASRDQRCLPRGRGW